MSDLVALRQYRDRSMFGDWAPYVSDERIAAATDNVRRLIDDIAGLGANPDEDAVRNAVDACVRRFNELDDGWICTIEREDIAEVLWKVIDLAGFEGDEDWLEEREW